MLTLKQIAVGRVGIERRTGRNQRRDGGSVLRARFPKAYCGNVSSCPRYIAALSRDSILILERYNLSPKGYLDDKSTASQHRMRHIY